MATAVLAVAWLVGIAAAAFTGGDTAASLAAAGLLGLLSFAARPRLKTLALLAPALALIFLAGWRYEATQPEPAPIARFNDSGQSALLRGKVSAEPEERGRTRLYHLDVSESHSQGSWHADSGRVLMRSPIFPEYHYGDVLEIEGELSTPPELPDFDFRSYLLRRGITSIVEYPHVRILDRDAGNSARSALFDLRSTIAGDLERAMPEPEASLTSAILLGAGRDIPNDLKEKMRETGTSHLVAVSGQNVVLLAGLVIGGLAWIIGRRPAAWVALAVVVAYALLVGGQPSVIRAAIMGSLYIAALALGRQNAASFALAIAAAGMTAVDPQVVHDVSFQLSFAATLGLILLASPLNSLLEGVASRWPGLREFPLTRVVIDTSSMTTAAILFTLPISAINFHQISIIAPVANLVAVPAFAGVGIGAGLAAGVNLVIPGELELTGWITWVPAAYMVLVIEFFAALPAASVELRGIHVEHAVAWFAVLVPCCLWLGKRVRRPEPSPFLQPALPRRLVPAPALALVLALASIIVWLVAAAPQSGRLTVTFLDVGQGDAILISGPSGHHILVDTGPSGDSITAALGRNLSVTDDRLDLLVVTHPQQDHIGGMPAVLERFEVRSVLGDFRGAESAATQASLSAIEHEGLEAIAPTRGQSIDLGHGARLIVLSPGRSMSSSPEINDESAVIQLTYGRQSFLLTGDITAAAEAALLATGTKVETTVLKVAHHGSRTSTSPDFLVRADPDVNVISVGAENPYGHPSAEIIERLNRDLLLRTDESGDITLSTDGERVWLRTDHGTTPSAVTAR